MKQAELLDEAVERKATLQDEINEIEGRITAAETRDPPVPPPGPAPEVPIVLPPPAYEDEEDEEMENEASATGAGVGDFVAPSEKKVINSTFRKRASLRLTETRSSMFAVLAKLSSHGLLKLSEQCSALAKDRDPELGQDEPALRATEDDYTQGTPLGKYFSTQKLMKRRRHLFF